MDTTLKLMLTGTRPLLMHNGRLANPLDPYTRKIAAIAKKRNKTDSDLAELASIEARGGMYETAEMTLGLPFDNVWRCVFDAAKAFKLGKDVERALMQTPEIAPLLIDGEQKACDKYLLEPNSMMYIPVRIGNGRTMRARALIPAGWEATVAFTLLSDILQPERLVPVLERAGRLVGLCDWRPKYGTFIAKMSY